MSRAVAALIGKLKGEVDYRFESQLSSRELMSVLLLRGAQIVRGMWHRLMLGSCGSLLFCGRGVRIEHPYNVFLGRSVILEDNVTINGLSTSGVRLGDRVTVRRGATLVGTGVVRRKGEGITIAEGSSIGDLSHLGGQGGISVGANVLIGPGVMVFSEDHCFSDAQTPIRKQGETRARVFIEDDCWIGAGSVILRGVRVGRGAVVGAGSVVTRDVPELSVVVGAPARVVKKRTPGSCP